MNATLFRNFRHAVESPHHFAVDLLEHARSSIYDALAVSHFHLSIAHVTRIDFVAIDGRRLLNKPPLSTVHSISIAGDRVLRCNVDLFIFSSERLLFYRAHSIRVCEE